MSMHVITIVYIFDNDVPDAPTHTHPLHVSRVALSLIPSPRLSDRRGRGCR
jgi:hypothetical protein